MLQNISFWTANKEKRKKFLSQWLKIPLTEHTVVRTSFFSMNSTITHYPVGNGDQSLIKLEDSTTVLFDCNIRQASVDSTDPKCYDVKAALLKALRKRDNNPYVDVFILTHGDCDHCRGFKDHFYQGAPGAYTDADRKANRIIVDEMWFSPMIAEEHTNDDEDVYQTEAERRLKLHRDGHPDRDLPGNRIKIVGYDGNKDYADLNDLRAIPGTVVNTFNGKTQTGFSMFIHAPFKEHLQSAEADKNSTSIVIQARFKSNPFSSGFTGLVMLGGDSDHYSWNVILNKTKKHNNEEALYWDVFLAPHHCSWTFFNDTPQKANNTPVSTALEVLNYARKGAWVVASSKKIVNDDDNPPHAEAKDEYIKKLTSSAQFLNTAVHPKESKPEPIVFEVTSSGIHKLKAESELAAEKLQAALAVASTAAIKKPWGTK